MREVLYAIDKAQVARYLGYHGSAPDERMAALIDECEKMLLKTARPRYTYRVFDLYFSKEGVQVGKGGLLLTGDDIRSHLKGCERAALLAATLSTEADRLIKMCSLVDALRGMVVDCCASAAIEQLCDIAEKEIKAQYLGCDFPFRYSPGYGDLPLSLQRDFLQFVDAPRKIGLTVNDSSMMIPVKSVTAILGISSSSAAKGRKSCDICRWSGSCEFQKRGEHCGAF